MREVWLVGVGLTCARGGAVAGAPGAGGSEHYYWGALPPQARRELEQYARQRYLPKYQDECARYYRALSEP